MKSLEWKLIPIFILMLISLSACSDQTPPEQVPPTPTIIEVNPTQSEISPSPEGVDIGLTYQRADGNRLVEGQGNVPGLAPLRVPLPGQIEWLVAVPYQGGSLWAAVLEDGTVIPVLVREGQAEILDLGWGPLPPGTPPLVVAAGSGVDLYGPATAAASTLTHPAFLSADPLRLAFVESGGDLVLLEEGIEIARLAAEALPDARVLVDDQGRLLFLSGPTTSYGHAVLGDGIEASSITLVETQPALQVLKRIVIPAPGVVEGIAPLWADLDGDGQREILVTVSDPDQGAQLVLYSEDGVRLAAGPPAGQGYRWRHQLLALPLDGGAEYAVYDVLRPHLDALFEVFRWRGEFLTAMEYIPNYPSHTIGSRNLDQTLAGDLDGDGYPEVVVPGSNGTTLNGLFYLEGALGQAWSVALGGKLTSNLAGLSLPDGSLALGAGVGEAILIWE